MRGRRRCVHRGRFGSRRRHGCRSGPRRRCGRAHDGLSDGRLLARCFAAERLRRRRNGLGGRLRLLVVDRPGDHRRSDPERGGSAQTHRHRGDRRRCREARRRFHVRGACALGGVSDRKRGDEQREHRSQDDHPSGVDTSAFPSGPASVYAECVHEDGQAMGLIPAGPMQLSRRTGSLPRLIEKRVYLPIRPGLEILTSSTAPAPSER